MLWCFWFVGLGVGRLDGIDWDEGWCEQFAVAIWRQSGSDKKGDADEGLVTVSTA
jgi:hypothetical protein